MIRTCIHCKEEKDIELFAKSPDRFPAYKNFCKECKNKKDRSKSFPPANINSKSCKKCFINQDINNFDLNKRHLDGYEKHCKKCRSLKNKERYLNSKEKIKNNSLKYYYANKPKIYASRRIRAKKRLKIDPFHKLKRNLRNRLYYALKNTTWKKNTHFSEYIGCERALLISHIESQFTLGMSWDNYGEFEIDHIIPLASAKTEEELYKLCHYTNLQPLWKEENASKGAKLTA